jgi:hypothetical protein
MIAPLLSELPWPGGWPTMEPPGPGVTCAYEPLLPRKNAPPSSKCRAVDIEKRFMDAPKKSFGELQ